MSLTTPQPTPSGVRRPLAAALVLALLPLVAVWLTAAPASTATWRPVVNSSVDPERNLDEFEDRVLVQLNKRRAGRDLRRVKVFETCLDGMSERWGKHLAETGDFYHRDQGKVLDRCDLSWAGENLARGESMTPRAVVRAWWASPGHRAIMLKPRATRAGLAVKRLEDGRLVAVLNLGDHR
jgi:uncharacterized protein YkwD